MARGMQSGIMTRVYKSGSIIYFENDKSEYIYILKSGRVWLTYTKIDTGEEIKEDVRQGEFFGVKQSGTMNFALGDIYSNADILKMASEAVDYLKKEGYNFQKLHQYSLEKNLNFAKNI